MNECNLKGKMQKAKKTIRSVIMTFTFFILICSSPLLAKSLFDEKDKDAESSLVVDVEKDRKITRAQNYRAIQDPSEYFASKVTSLEKDLARVNRRVDRLEARLKSKEKGKKQKVKKQNQTAGN